MTSFRHAKIMPTLGPSTWDEPQIEALVRAGANAFRLNFSHGDAKRHRQTYANVRAVEKRLGKHIPILQDLQGPKIRIGDMAEAVQLAPGTPFTLDADPAPGTIERVQLPHADILASLRTGDTVALNDGVIRLKVTEATPTRVETQVLNGGLLSSRKGVNVPGRELPMEVLTAKDKADLEVGLDMGVDWVALSFVQKAEDILAARTLIAGRAFIMAKIETQAAVAHLEDIIAVSDAIMIARGDLGVELPPEDVPPLQRKIIAICRRMGKPAVVATQMLESMIQNPVPTRAEASDVATAAYEGADCLMLSAESASGKHPVEAVAVMARIISRIEETPRVPMVADFGLVDFGINDATCEAACNMAAGLGAACIVAFTETGGTAMRMVRWRPARPVICLTPHLDTARRMALVWGVEPVLADEAVDGTDNMVAEAIKAAGHSGLATLGQNIVITAGIPFRKAGSTNLIRVAEVA